MLNSLMCHCALCEGGVTLWLPVTKIWLSLYNLYEKSIFLLKNDPYWPLLSTKHFKTSYFSILVGPNGLQMINWTTKALRILIKAPKKWSREITRYCAIKSRDTYWSPAGGGWDLWIHLRASVRLPVGLSVHFRSQNPFIGLFWFFAQSCISIM